MNNWKLIQSFYYRKMHYAVLINQKLERIFMRILDDGSYDYSNIKEFIELSFFIKRCPVIRDSLQKNIDARVVVGKKVIPFALALSLLFPIPCYSESKTVSDLEKIGLVLESSEYNDFFYYVDRFDTEKCVENPYYITPSLFGEMSFNNFCSPEEYENLLKKNITWNDVYDLLNSMDLDEKVKSLLLDGIHELEKKSFQIELSVFYHNLRRLKIQYVDSSVMSNIGLFFLKTGDVLLNKDYLEEDFFNESVLHEIMGHGMLRGYFLDNNGVICDVGSGYFIINENGAIESNGTLGYFMIEAMADIIASEASGKKLKSASHRGYLQEVYVLSLLASSLDIKMDELANKGVEYLASKMYENGIENPYSYLLAFDTRFELFLSEATFDNEDYSLEELLGDYFSELVQYKRQNGESEEKIQEWLNQVLHSYNHYIEPSHVNGHDILYYGDLVIDCDEICSTIQNELFSSKVR